MDQSDSTRSGVALLEAPGTHASPEAREAPATKTILLLDAARLFLQFEETVLQRREWTLLTATTGAEALAIVRSRSVDLLVMDHALPDMTGADVVRVLRLDRETRGVPVLVVTARGGVEALLESGCSAVLHKPVSRQALCEKVEGLLAVQARRHLRTMVRLRVDARHDATFFFGSTVNLSSGGMLLESPLDLGVGERVDLRFQLPGDPEPLIVRARAVRTLGDGAAPLHGLEFEDLAAHERERIETFVRVSRVGVRAPEPEAPI